MNTITQKELFPLVADRGSAGPASAEYQRIQSRAFYPELLCSGLDALSKLMHNHKELWGDGHAPYVYFFGNNTEHPGISYHVDELVANGVGVSDAGEVYLGGCYYMDLMGRQGTSFMGAAVAPELSVLIRETIKALIVKGENAASVDTQKEIAAIIKQLQAGIKEFTTERVYSQIRQLLPAFSGNADKCAERLQKIAQSHELHNRFHAMLAK